MVAQHQGLLMQPMQWRLCAAGLLIVLSPLCSCAGGPSAEALAPSADGGSAANRIVRAAGSHSLPEVTPPAARQVVDGLGPEILLPSQDSNDDLVATVGDLELRQSHAFKRLLSAHPKLALSAVDLLIFDVLVAGHAKEHGVSVSETRVQELAASEERELRHQVEQELEGVTFSEYVWRLFGMREQDWQSALRLRTAQRLYQGYVLRYLALREDQVQVRFLVHKDKSVAQEVVDKVRVGADFATLALRWSEDPSRREGGLLPAFGRGFQHPASVPAFQLKAGDVSDPFAAQWGGEQRWFVVYCLEHRAGRDEGFEAVREEIDADLERAPVTPLETTAYTLRWRNKEERQAKDSSK